MFNSLRSISQRIFSATLGSFLMIILSLTLTVAGDLSGQSILDKKISIEVENVPFDEVIKLIEDDLGIEFVYLSGVLDAEALITLKIENKSLSVLLKALFQPKNITYQLDNNFVILTKTNSQQKKEIEELDESRMEVANQNKEINGQVLDETGEGIPFVTILVKGTKNGTTSDLNGNFSLRVNEGSILVLSFIGYKSTELTIDKREYYTVQLEIDLKSLDEIVVVGYGTSQKVDVLGAITSVDMKDLKVAPVANFDAALQGISSGVSVLSQSGKPGAATTIRIRGANSINLPTDPLWIIDGMPIYSDPSGLGTSNLNPMATINPNDIERIDVLKDAAATAIYGSRGSNGVILVTTKKGKNGESFTNINLSSGISQLTRTPDDVGYVNADEWLEAMDIAYNNSLGRDFRLADYYQRSPNANDIIDRSVVDVLNINTDWFDETFRRASFKQLNVSTSRGFDQGSMYLSAGYRNDRGVLDHNELDRVSIRSNLNYKVSERVTLDSRLFFSYTEKEDRSDDLTTITKFALPWMPVFNPNETDSYFNPYTGTNLKAINDPNNQTNNSKTYRGLINISLNYDVPLIEGLSLRTEFSADIIQANTVDYRSRFIRLNSGNEPSARAVESANTYTSLNYNAYGTYKRKFDLHSITVLAGAEAQRFQTNRRVLSAEGLPGNQPQIGTSGGDAPSVISELTNERYLMGMFSRINYNYDNRYLFGISGRRDGSSVLTPEFRWSNFVSVSAGWILSEEYFFRNASSSLFLKLRASYGQTGNQGIPRGVDQIEYFEQAIFGSRSVASNGTLPANVAVNDLTWETTNSSDVALDFGFLKNKVEGSIGVYNRNVQNLFLQVQLPSSAGISPLSPDPGEPFRFVSSIIGDQVNNIWDNTAELTNSGFEFEISTKNIDNDKFKWTTSLNITLTSNKIKSLAPELNTGIGLTNNPYTVVSVGRRRFVWYVADYAGVDSETGVPYIFARDQEIFNSEGRTVRLQTSDGSDSLIYATRANVQNNHFVQEGKSSDPTYFGGITNKFEYKGFDLSFLLSFSGGNYILDYDRQIAVYPNETRTLLREALYESWREPGDQAKYPKLVRGGVMEIDGESVSGFNDEDVYHNRDLYKGDFIRLRNITLGYNLNSQMIEKVKLKSMRVYVSAINLFTWTDYPGFDPEGVPTNGAQIIRWNTPIPQLKTFMAGLDVRF